MGCGVNCSSCCSGKILSGIGWVQQDFVAHLFKEKLMVFSITNFWDFYFIPFDSNVECVGSPLAG